MLGVGSIEVDCPVEKDIKRLMVEKTFIWQETELFSQRNSGKLCNNGYSNKVEVDNVV